MEIDWKIEVWPTICHECMEFHYVILEWQPPKEGREGFWHNTGICGTGKSPYLAFLEAMKRFEER